MTDAQIRRLAAQHGLAALPHDQLISFARDLAAIVMAEVVEAEAKKTPPALDWRTHPRTLPADASPMSDSDFGTLPKAGE